MTNTLDVLVEAKKSIHALDIPSRELAEKCVNSALNLVVSDLQEGNINGAIETKNKFESFEHLFKRQHATLITQNVMAVGRIGLIREIGAYVRDNYEHDKGGGAPHTRHEVLSDLPITSVTYLKWMDAADIDPDEFEKFVAPFLDEKVKDDIDGIFLGKILSYFYPNKYNDPDVPDLLPVLKHVWILGRDYMDALTEMVTACSGDTPAEQVTIVFEQMDKVTIANKEAKSCIRDLYQRSK